MQCQGLTGKASTNDETQFVSGLKKLGHLTRRRLGTHDYTISQRYPGESRARQCVRRLTQHFQQPKGGTASDPSSATIWPVSIDHFSSWFRYQTTRKPFSTITYTFWQRPEMANCMVLSPPLDLLNVRPMYHISVTMNCFTPSSCITTIRRESIEGEFVGDFEMGLTNKKTGTVCIRGNEYPINDLLESGYRPFKNAWVWKTPEFEKPSSLYWDDSSGSGFTCFSSKDKVNTNLLARFLLPTHSRKVGRPTEMTRLEVSPQGHELFDDILISALILERMRTTPSG